jgi:hypothetical protein
MSTFYVLPARPQLGQRFAELLTTLFPGTLWEPADWPDLGEALGAAAMCQPDLYIVYSEDLPADLSLEDGLIYAFGAEPGDQVIESKPGRGLTNVAIQRWRVGEALAA